MLFPGLEDYLSHWLSRFKSGCSIVETQYITGGSINEAYKIRTTCGICFLKYNSASKYPEMFTKEKAALELLSGTNTVIVPEVLTSDTFGNCSFLLLKYESPTKPTKNYWTVFAKHLSSLHQVKAKHYGLDYDNYIGSLPQINTYKDDYIEFFISCRLNPLLRSAVDKGLLSHKDILQFENLYKLLPDMLSVEKPSLIHGDLWSGNLIVNHKGLPCVIDPAIYYGHRESDIAMTKLFGGFPISFYDTYQSCLPMEKGWEERIPIHQLYPLLIHVNLFGMSYASQLRNIITRY